MKTKEKESKVEGQNRIFDDASGTAASAAANRKYTSFEDFYKALFGRQAS